MEPIRIIPVRIEDMGDRAIIFDKSGAVYELGDLDDGLAHQLVRILSPMDDMLDVGIDGAKREETVEGEVQAEEDTSPVAQAAPQPKAAESEPNVLPVSIVSPVAQAAPQPKAAVIEPNMLPVSIVTPSGETLVLPKVSESQTVGFLKQELAAKSGMNAIAMALFVIDDNRQDQDQENLALQNSSKLHEVMLWTESATELELAVVLDGVPPPEWDPACKGDTISLSAEEHDTLGRLTIATQNSSSSFVRSKEPMMPQSGTHFVEYVYTDADRKSQGEALSIYLIVGVVKGSVPTSTYGTDWDVGRSEAWWGLVSGGGVFEGARKETKKVPGGGLGARENCAGDRNAHHVPYGAGDRIGFAVDMDVGTMHFYRNGALIPGASIEGMEVNEPLYIVGCPRTSGTTVTISRPEHLPYAVDGKQKVC
jgi:hypothetical protein